MDDLAIKSVRRWLVRVPVRRRSSGDPAFAPASRGSSSRSTTAGGVVGWGETICLLDAIPAVLDRVVIPLAIGRGVDAVEAFHRHVLGAGYYHHKRAAVMAMCAVEMAMWDAFGKVCGQPLYRLWGGRWRQRIALAAYLLQSDPAKVVADARAYRDAATRRSSSRSATTSAPTSSSRASCARSSGPTRRCASTSTARGRRARPSASAAASLPFDPAYIEQPLELDDLGGPCRAARRRSRSRSRSTRARTRCRTSATSCARRPPT